MKSSLRALVAVAGAFAGLFCACITPGGQIYAAPISDRPDAVSAGAGAPALAAAERVAIPGPLRSFLRMAGISQEVPLDEVLPLLARNTYLLGYDESTQTEFLRLVNRYLHQARELQILAGANGTIHVANCKDAGTLLKVLGYRLRQGCGEKDALLETANPTRAFLTIDSGFPLIELEEALENNTPFDYPYPSAWIPVLFKQNDWLALGSSEKVGFGSVVDILANDRGIARLYFALAKEDAETSVALDQSAGLRKLLPYAATLDFYGSQISIRSGHVAVPGGATAEPSWKELAGASPDSPRRVRHSPAGEG